MTPDQILAYVNTSNLGLVPGKRTDPDGWAFWLTPPTSGVNSNRIFRAVRSSPDATTKLKLAVTSRLSGEADLDFTGDEAALRDLIEKEIALYRAHYDKN